MGGRGRGRGRKGKGGDGRFEGVRGGRSKMGKRRSEKVKKKLPRHKGGKFMLAQPFET